MSAENLKAEFDKIFKYSIIPILKELGFKRKGQNFIRPINDITQCLNIQKHSSSYLDCMSFTFNIGFYNKQILDITCGRDVVIDFPKVTDCFIEDRLRTYPFGRGSWYELNNRIDKEKLAEQIENGLEQYLKPLLDKYQSLEDLKQFDLERNTSFDLYQIVFLMLTNQIEEGTRLWREKYKSAFTPQKVIVASISGQGTKETEFLNERLNKPYIEILERLANTYGISL